MLKVFDFLELNELIQVMDEGASAIAEVPVYKPLLDNGWAELNAFEGDERQADGITGAYGNRAEIYRDFLFDGTEQTLYVTDASTGMTSLRKPRMPALKFFNGFETFAHIERTQRVQTRRLDDVEGLPLIDFLKMDIQGAELMVLEGMTGRIASIDAFIIETSIISSVKGGAEVHDVVRFMHQHGFALADIVGMTRRPLDGATAQIDLLFVPEDDSPLRRDRRWSEAA